MNMWVLLFASLPVVLGGGLSGQEGSICIRAEARSCDECLQVSESCGWCSEEFFLKAGERTSSRCDDLASLKKRNCDEKKIENPRGSITVTENKPFTSRDPDVAERLKSTQIQPQKVSVALRAGEPQVFELKFKRVADVPVDLYYLMDLSSSRKNTLESIKQLAADLSLEMQRITSDFRIGFGSIMPHLSTTPAGLTNQNCTSFTNVLKLTDKWEEFERLVGQLQVSGKPDSPAGGLDAMMQAAACEEQIGWRNATRLLVFSTDGGFQLAGDGTLGAAAPSNDGRCHLEDHMDTTSLTGRPCVARLVQKLSENNIQTVFAVTEELQPVFKELKNLLPNSAVGTLSSNSSDVIKLVTDIYNSLSSEVTLENGRLPEGVSIAYRSVCQSGVVGTHHNGRKCSNISIGDEVSFQVSLESQKCVSQSPVTVAIRPLGFTEEVQLLLSFICSCQCAKDREANSQRCYHGNGTFECGACKCNDGRVGPVCECSTDEYRAEDVNAMCRTDDGSAICSNNGDCVCGTCECKKRENPAEVYSGRYCECDNFNCHRSSNKLCGGHGICQCRQCICDDHYTGSACDCSLDTSTCLAPNGQICNGRGFCECGVCICTDPKFQGPTCAFCPTCPGACSEHKHCVECRAFGTGEKKDTCEQDCSYFQLIKVQRRENLPHPEDVRVPFVHCKERTDDSWIYFTYAAKDGGKEVHVVQTTQ